MVTTPDEIPPHLIAEADQLIAMDAEFGESTAAMVAAALAEPDLYACEQAPCPWRMVRHFREEGTLHVLPDGTLIERDPDEVSELEALARCARCRREVPFGTSW